MRTLRKDEYEGARQAFIEGKLRLNLMPGGATQEWAKSQGWPSGMVGFKDNFVRKAIETKENWELAWTASSADFFTDE